MNLELQERLQSTSELITRYQKALELPTTSPSDALALRVNLRTLRNLVKRITEGR